MNNTPTIKSALVYGKQELLNAGIASYNLDARLLLAHILNYSIEKLIISLEKTLTHNEWLFYQQLITRRTKFEPIVHLTGIKEFFSLEFRVNKNTLIPRPDSETLIETVLKYFPDKSVPLKILDLGTGTGCLILTLLNLYFNSTGLGIDLSIEALKIARFNSIHLTLDSYVLFVQNSWCNSLSNQAKYDVIISNPPYISHEELQKLDNEVKDYEPNLALDGGQDGLDCYREIASTIIDFLSKNGKIFLEIGQGQEESVKQIFKAHNMNCISEHKDLNQIIRCLVFERHH
ncbi:Release factor glutamine methyltransferase [Rickettsiales bacterium Ac37b]|nr:Release factor glutamine methyltransferase [Rickettsiales bacterium Ac37b]